jgi:hypothetical protein
LILSRVLLIRWFVMIELNRKGGLPMEEAV